MPREVGIGVPSKYLLFPVLSFGNEDTVTLKRARRVKPQRTKKERRRVSRGVRRPRAKAQEAGATPKEICKTNVSPCTHRASKFYRRGSSQEKKKKKKKHKIYTYQIRQRIQLLPHQTALTPPPRDLPIHKVEEEPERHECQRCPYVTVGVWGAKTVAHGREDGHETAKAWRIVSHVQTSGLEGSKGEQTIEFGNQVSEVESSGGVLVGLLIWGKGTGESGPDHGEVACVLC